MIATKSKQTEFDKSYRGVATDLKLRMQNATVKLATSRFTGTGVILTKDATYTYILSALHNVYMLEKPQDPPAWNEQLLKDFRSAVTLRYGSTPNMDFGSDPGSSAPISALTDIKLGDTSNWEYDVLFLRSSDTGLKTYAAANAIYIAPGRPVPAMPASGAGDLPFALKQSDYLGPGIRVPKKTGKLKPNFYVQMGFGSTTEPDPRPTGVARRLPATDTEDEKGSNVKGRLQYRMVTVQHSETATVYNQIGDTENYSASQHCIQVTADADDSTGSGDSGGPLFALNYDAAGSAYRVDLIGITTGADMLPDSDPHKPCPSGSQVRVNNIVTSLEQFYRNLGTAGVRTWRT
jgi:hypothetical protein